MSFEAVAKAFSGHYYSTFDSNRAALINLYTDQSLLTFEGERYQGKTAIVKKLTDGLKFNKSKHRISTMDAQPAPGNGVLVFVGGEILVEGEDKPLRFCQVFNLQPVPGQNGSYFILNDLFRLQYA